jgi:hypothetical protein
MHAYLKKNTRVMINLDAEEDEERNEEAPQPCSGIKYKQVKKKTQTFMSSFVVSAPTKPTTQKQSKSVSFMLCKTPEEVVVERHKGSSSHSTLEHCTKKGKEAKQIIEDHVAGFLYENKISLNIVNSIS